MRLTGKNVSQQYELRGICKDGSERFLEMFANPITYNGNPAIQGTVVDITERKQAEMALKISERKRIKDELAAEKERLTVTLRNIGDGVISTDLEGKITSLNKVAEDLTGWKEDQAMGQPLADVFHIVNEFNRNRCEDPVGKVLQTGGIIGLANNTILISKNGKESVIADSGAPIKDSQNKIIGAVLAFRDITDKRKMEAELVKVQKLESLGVLAGGIAHDFITF